LKLYLGIFGCIWVKSHTRPQMLPIKFRVIWPSRFRGNHFFKKSTNQKLELSLSTMFLNRSGRIHRCILSRFGSFGWAFSEEKIKVWKVNGRRTPSDWKKLTLSLVEQKLLSLPEFTTSEVRVDQSLVSIYHCLLYVGHCIACPLIYASD
jgi:hypothetical protein